jgi:hypothetical protein
VDARRKKGAYAFIAMVVAWLATIFTVQMVQAHQSGYGTGFGDGKLKPSLLTPGGPFYPEEKK